MPTTPPPPIPPLTLIIRFTTSLPDLPLSIPRPRRTTPLTLATLIRPHLPPTLSACAIRLPPPSAPSGLRHPPPVFAITSVIEHGGGRKNGR